MIVLKSETVAETELYIVVELKQDTGLVEYQIISDPNRYYKRIHFRTYFKFLAIWKFNRVKKLLEACTWEDKR